MIWTKHLIPSEWSGDQARAVIELLDRIAAAVWDVHEDEILASINREETRLERAARGDDEHPGNDDFPF